MDGMLASNLVPSLDVLIRRRILRQVVDLKVRVFLGIDTCRHSEEFVFDGRILIERNSSSSKVRRIPRNGI